MGAYGDEVAFSMFVAYTQHLEVWVARDCTVEKLVATGDFVSGHRIAKVEGQGDRRTRRTAI